MNIVYHIAASVRFDDSLKYAILLNTRGTRELVSLALEMKNLTLFAHVSTAYANTQTKVIEEKLYPPQADWRKTIEIAEQVDSYTLDLLTNKYLGCQPNTYTFTKHLAEHVVNDMCTGRIPAVIIRPSVGKVKKQNTIEYLICIIFHPNLQNFSTQTNVNSISHDKNIFGAAI